MTDEARTAAAAAGDHPVVEAGARLGYVASGVVHLLIAWVAIQLAWFTTGEQADQVGALRNLAETGLGAVPLWVAIAGFAFLALWSLTEAIVRRDAGPRARSAAKAVAYGTLAWSTFTVVRGSSSDGGEQSADATSAVMAQPFGQALVAAAGLAVIGIGGYHVMKGVKATFLEDLDENPGTWTVRAGRAGYVAKGLALALVGALLVSAAVTRQPEQARGLDGALRTLLEQPFGAVLLTAVALGLASYGLYSFGRARFARL